MINYLFIFDYHR